MTLRSGQVRDLLLLDSMRQSCGKKKSMTISIRCDTSS